MIYLDWEWPSYGGLGCNNIGSGRFSETEALYRQIFLMQPNHADALHLSGLIAHQGGKADALP